MQINVVEGSSPAMFTAMVFPQATEDVKNWLRDQWATTTSMLTETGKHYAQQAYQLYDSLVDNTLFRKVRAVLGKEHDKRPDVIWQAETLEDIQGLKPLMQRYVMAMPQIRQLYHEQRCDGYSDSYVDLYPDAVGEGHVDYERVMSGIVTELPAIDGKEPGWKATMYPNDVKDGDRELEADEQFKILNTWDWVGLYVARGEDPTSMIGDKIN